MYYIKFNSVAGEKYSYSLFAEMKESNGVKYFETIKVIENNFHDKETLEDITFIPIDEILNNELYETKELPGKPEDYPEYFI
jgi:hypothetical protein